MKKPSIYFVRYLPMCNDTGGETGEWDLLKTKFAVVPYWIQLTATDSRNKKFKLRVSSHDFSLNITHMTHFLTFDGWLMMLRAVCSWISLLKNSRSQLAAADAPLPNGPRWSTWRTRQDQGMKGSQFGTMGNPGDHGIFHGIFDGMLMGIVMVNRR